MNENLLYILIGAVALIGIPVLRAVLRLDNGASSFESRRRGGKILADHDEEQKFVDKYSK